MAMLEQLHKGKRKAPRRVLMHGVPGVGKSTWPLPANAVYVPTEEGLNDIDCCSMPLCTTFAQFIDTIGELYLGEHSFSAAVVDTVDWLERLITADVCRARKVASIEEIPYGKGSDFALPLWQQVLSALGDLRNKRGMHIILLAHSKVEKFKDPTTDPYDRYSPKLHKTAAALLQEWCDDVLFATYRIYTSTTDEGFNRTRTKGMGTGERVVKTTERPAYVAKNHLNLPDELPLDWNAYAQYLAA